MPFTTDLVSVSQVSPTRWQLLEPVVYEGRNQTFTVPAGFVTDFATVPRIFFWLVPTYGVYTKAAILHDYLVEHPELVSRADADGIFRRTLRELGVPFVRRWMMWAAVRLQAGLAGTTPGDLVRWLLVAVPSVLLLLVPALVVLVWLGLLWLVELVAHLVLRVRGTSEDVPGAWPPSGEPAEREPDQT